MKFTVAIIASFAAYASASAIAPRDLCIADRHFGLISTTFRSNTALKPGDIIDVTDDFTCAVAKGIKIKSIGYTIEPLSGTNFDTLPVAFREFDASVPIVTFPVTIPHFSYVKGISYIITGRAIYEAPGTDGTPVTYFSGTLSNEIGLLAA